MKESAMSPVFCPRVPTVIWMEPVKGIPKSLGDATMGIFLHPVEDSLALQSSSRVQTVETLK